MPRKSKIENRGFYDHSSKSQGAHDRLVKPKSSEKIFEDLRTSDKQLIELAQGEHLTFEDGQFDDMVVSQVESWLANHSNAPILSASTN